MKQESHSASSIEFKPVKPVYLSSPCDADITNSIFFNFSDEEINNFSEQIEKIKNSDLHEDNWLSGLTLIRILLGSVILILILSLVTAW